MITIVLADDHNAVRQSLRALLEAKLDCKIVGEASDGLEASLMVERLHPDVLICDLMMSGTRCIELTRRVSKQSPETGVVIFSSYTNEGYVVEALRAGAKAYVPKESALDELVRAVREVSVGHCYLGLPLTNKAIEAYLRKVEATKAKQVNHCDTKDYRARSMTASVVSLK